LEFIERKMKMENKKKKFNLEHIDIEFFESELEVEDLEADEHVKKKVEKYLNLNYPIKLYKDQDESGPYWIAEHPDLPGCKSHGETEDEAIKNLKDAKESWLNSFVDLGKDIPTPNQQKEIDNCSGKILIRIPKELHYKLLVKSKHDGISLNQEILYLLSSSFGEKVVEDSLDLINEKLDKIHQKNKEETFGDKIYGTLETLNYLLSSESKTYHKVKENVVEDLIGSYEKPVRNRQKGNITFDKYNSPFIQ
jgi:antitoxin HicB